MAVYKVIQDIEAEDKILGPFGLKQFGYAFVAVFCAFINFQFIVHSDIGPARFVGVLMFIWPMILFGVLAAPLGGAQPTEVWLLARLRFFLKPQKRIWDQSGAKQLVTITVPKKVEKHLTKDFTQSEVHSRLQALATTLDSRGWAVKNVSVNLFAEPGYLTDTNTNEDRLVGTESLPQEVPAIDVRAEDDILDTRFNPTAHHVDVLVKEKTEEVKKQTIQNFNQAINSAASQDNDKHGDGRHHKERRQDKLPADNSGEPLVTFDRSVVSPGDDPHSRGAAKLTPAEEAKFTKLMHELSAHDKHRESFSRLPKIMPLNKQRELIDQMDRMTDEQRTAKLKELANNDDYSVATIAKQAKRESAKSGEKPRQPEKHNDDDEVVVSLR